VTADGQPPAVALAVPTAPSDARLPITWSATDAGSGVATYDVEVSTDGGPFVPWLAATTATAATYDAARGHSYRFRARARDALGSVSEYVTSGEVAVPAQATTTPPPLAPIERAPADLGVRAVTRRGSRLVVRGSIAATAWRPLALRLTGRAGGRHLAKALAVRTRRGRLTASIRAPLPASGTLTLRYPGDELLTPQSIRVRFRGV
jgi:hypothetical protein